MIYIMSELTGLELLMNQFGEDAYRGTHIGRRTGRTYYLFITSNNGIAFDINAYYLNDSRVNDAGFYSAAREDVVGINLKNLLSLPKINKRFIYLLNVGTNVTSDGIASALLDVLILELNKRKALHVVSFNEEGFEKMKKKYDALGYQDCEVINLRKLFEWFGGLKNWMFYDYR